MDRHKSISLADQIFERLETDILLGKYAQGDILTENQLSENLGVSRTPIREALRRLQQEKLVADSSRGMVVLGISLEDIKDIYAIRIPIEKMALERFIATLTDEKLKKLKDIIDVQEFYGNRKDAEQITYQDNEFHETIYENCGSGIIGETLINLHRKVVKYRKASIENGRRAEESIGEHKAIYEAIAAKDVEKADMLLIKHIKNAESSILNGGNK